KNGHALVSERGDAGAEGHLLIGVRSPILRAGRSATLLVASVARRSIGSLIAQHTFPPGWTATIYDREGHVLATSDVDRAGLGRHATPAILDAVARKATGVAQISTTDRQRFYAGFARPSLSGWVVTVGVPLDAVEASLRRSLLLVAAAGVLSIVLVLGAALVIGRRIADPLVALAAAAPAVVRGERVALRRTARSSAPASRVPPRISRWPPPPATSAAICRPRRRTGTRRAGSSASSASRATSPSASAPRRSGRGSWPSPRRPIEARTSSWPSSRTSCARRSTRSSAGSACCAR